MSGGSIALEGAAEVLLPPRPGLARLRGRDLAGQSLPPGGLTAADGVITELAADPRAAARIDATGCAVVPGFVDCHTHLPFAGWRAGEYEQKLRGVPYADISQSGGGIAASARALAEASDEAILAQASGLAAEMLAHGTTTFEMKSGYGLSRDGELRALALAAELGRRVPQTTLSTALLAHAVPPGYDREGWMREVEAMMPEVLSAGTVSALDIFVESIAFAKSDLELMGRLAAAGGLALRAHVEQFTHQGAVPVALAAGARSVDHLSMLAADDLGGLEDAECAAVLLPAAEFLGAEHRAPGRGLLDAGALVALATDANPGTSPVISMPLVIGLAMRLYGMTTLEALAAATLNAAWVLGLARTHGSIEVGKRADLLILDGPVERIGYRLGRNPVAIALIGGEPVYVREDAAGRISTRGSR